MTFVYKLLMRLFLYSGSLDPFCMLQKIDIAMTLPMVKHVTNKKSTCSPQSLLRHAIGTLWYIFKFMSVCFTFQNSDFRHTKVSEKFRTHLVRNQSGQMIQRCKDLFKGMKFALVKPFRKSLIQSLKLS